jgi:5-methylcytosine-specific restriction endonuclease McrA
VIKPSKKKLSRSRMIGTLDAAARQQVFRRDGNICVRCRNRSNGKQWAHIISRRHLLTRWELDNALTLCGGCHFWFHSQPFLAQEWFRKNWPERYQHILTLFNSGEKTGDSFVRQQYESQKKLPEMSFDELPF